MGVGGRVLRKRKTDVALVHTINNSSIMIRREREGLWTFNIVVDNYQAGASTLIN